MKEGNARESPSAASDQDDSGTDRQRDKDGESDPFDQVLHPFGSRRHRADTSNACYEGSVKYRRRRHLYSLGLIPKGSQSGPAIRPYP